MSSAGAGVVEYWVGKPVSLDGRRLRVQLAPVMALLGPGVRVTLSGPSLTARRPGVPGFTVSVNLGAAEYEGLQGWWPARVWSVDPAALRRLAARAGKVMIGTRLGLDGGLWAAWAAGAVCLSAGEAGVPSLLGSLEDAPEPGLVDWAGVLFRGHQAELSSAARRALPFVVTEKAGSTERDRGFTAAVLELRAGPPDKAGAAILATDGACLAAIRASKAWGTADREFNRDDGSPGDGVGLLTRDVLRFLGALGQYVGPWRPEDRQDVRVLFAPPEVLPVAAPNGVGPWEAPLCRRTVWIFVNGVCVGRFEHDQRLPGWAKTAREVAWGELREPVVTVRVTAAELHRAARAVTVPQVRSKAGRAVEACLRVPQRPAAARVVELSSRTVRADARESVVTAQIPHDEPGRKAHKDAEVLVNPKYLLAIAETVGGKGLDLSRGPLLGSVEGSAWISLQIGEPTTPILATSGTGDQWIVMPMRGT